MGITELRYEMGKLEQWKEGPGSHKHDHDVVLGLQNAKLVQTAVRSVCVGVVLYINTRTGWNETGMGSAQVRT